MEKKTDMTGKAQRCPNRLGDGWTQTYYHRILPSPVSNVLPEKAQYIRTAPRKHTIEFGDQIGEMQGPIHNTCQPTFESPVNPKLHQPDHTEMAAVAGKEHLLLLLSYQSISASAPMTIVSPTIPPF